MYIGTSTRGGPSLCITISPLSYGYQY